MNTLVRPKHLNIFIEMSLRIIKEQELVIGPLAWKEAGKVSGLHIDINKKEEIVFDGDEKIILNRLVSQYERLFGKLSNEVCKDAVQDLIVNLQEDQIPSSLR